MTNQTADLLNALTAEQQKRTAEFDQELSACSSIDVIKQNNWLRSYLTPSLISCPDLIKVKAKLMHRRAQHEQKTISKFATHLNEVANAPEFTRINISIEWTKSRMWGYNPKCEATVIGVGRYYSGSIGGCGYDKESTAIANALNQSYSLLRALYEYKNNVCPTGINRDVFGYGAGYGILPELEGGVGVSCYPEIFKKIGCIFRKVASGKTFDVYEVVKN